MRKQVIIAIMIMASAVAFVGCKKDKPTPQEDTYTLKYAISNESRVTHPLSGEEIVTVLSPCFHFDIRYVDANGNTVEEHNVTAPWEKTLSITKPFHAKLEGTATFVESELPDTLNFGKPYSIKISDNGALLFDSSNSMTTLNKETFLEHFAGTDRMSFSGKLDFGE